MWKSDLKNYINRMLHKALVWKNKKEYQEQQQRW